MMTAFEKANMYTSIHNLSVFRNGQQACLEIGPDEQERHDLADNIMDIDTAISLINYVLNREQ